jgi:hypothetical protein
MRITPDGLLKNDAVKAALKAAWRDSVPGITGGHDWTFDKFGPSEAYEMRCHAVSQRKTLFTHDHHDLSLLAVSMQSYYLCPRSPYCPHEEPASHENQRYSRYRN